MRPFTVAALAASVIAAALSAPAAAADAIPSPPPLPPGITLPPPTPNDTLVSPQVGPGGRVTFRIYAPEARHVGVDGEFRPFGAPPLELVRQDNGVWVLTVEAIPAGAYRYAFVVDGVQVVDPRNVLTSRSMRQVRSLLVVADGDFAADRPGAPHGTITEVRYASPVLGVEREMRVYTPPGYRPTGKPYPVLYLLHGGGDSEDSWPTVGRAGVILDNLIAEGRAVPMVVVMPSGAVRPTGQPMTWDKAQDPFTTDLTSAIMPWVETHLNVSRRPEDTALAGLSMGGIQTLNIGLTDTQRFRWLGVFSSGWFPPDLKAFEQRYGANLGREAARLKLLWYSNGSSDIALPQAKSAYQMFDRRGVRYEPHETPGGHTWENWRANLRDFAPRLFRSGPPAP